MYHIARQPFIQPGKVAHPGKRLLCGALQAALLSCCRALALMTFCCSESQPLPHGLQRRYGETD